MCLYMYVCMCGFDCHVESYQSNSLCLYIYVCMYFYFCLSVSLFVCLLVPFTFSFCPIVALLKRAMCSCLWLFFKISFSLHISFSFNILQHVVVIYYAMLCTHICTKFARLFFYSLC